MINIIISGCLACLLVVLGVLIEDGFIMSFCYIFAAVLFAVCDTLIREFENEEED